MLRTIGVAAAGILLSAALIVLMSFVELHLTSFGEMARDVRKDSPTLRRGERQADPVRLLKESGLRRDLVYQPLIALAVGLLVGAAGRKSVSGVVVVALGPFIVLVVTSDPWVLRGLGFALGYAALALLTAHSLVRWRSRRRGAGTSAHTGMVGAGSA